MDKVDREEALQQTKGLSIFLPQTNRMGSYRASCMKLHLNEEVFLAQLALRAHLLNSEFQEEVIRIIECHGSIYGCSERNNLSPDGLFNRIITLSCVFSNGTGAIEICTTAPKARERMKQKLHKYAYPHPRSSWPLCANILDPVRISIVCHGASQVLEVVSWFVDQQDFNGLPVCRFKNRFAFPEEMVPDGYRDLQVKQSST